MGSSLQTLAEKVQWARPMAKRTSTTRKTTKMAAPTTAAITTWIGLSFLTSSAWSAERRIPRKLHATARNVCLKFALRAVAGDSSRGSSGVLIACSGIRLLAPGHRRGRRGTAHLEEGVRQRDGLDVPRQLVVDVEHHRPGLRLAG